MMLIRSTALVSIPDELYSEEAAPILCAGVATFNALKKSGAQAGDTVAILGVGGLGHMAVQYARNMGFKVIALGRGWEKEKEVLHFGAHYYLDLNVGDHIDGLKRIGGVHALVSTISNMEEVAKFLPALAPKGKLVLLGVDKHPLQISSGSLVSGERSVLGSITGTPQDSEKALDFSVLVSALPQIETMPLSMANEAFKKLKAGGAKYRIVLSVPKAVKQVVELEAA
jgi:alcohol dehydrogenase